MGNLCCAIRYAFRYTSGYILPMIRPYIPMSYMYVIEEDFTSMEDASGILEHSFTNGDELDTVESQNFDKGNEKTSLNNFDFLLDMVTNFFRNYNFQTNVLRGKVFERNLINAEYSLQKFKTDPFGLQQMKWNFRYKDLESNLDQIKVEDTNNNPECEENAGSRYMCDENQECNPKEQGEIESLVKEQVTVQSNKSSSRDRTRKYGTVTLAQREKFQHFSDCSVIDERKNFTKQISDDSRRRLVRSHNLRKLSMPNLHSGCYFLVEKSNENAKIANYSAESVPLRIHVDIYRRISHQNLLSGGWVSCEELSEHFCIPNYYSENPIIYKELPEGFEFPKYSPVKIPPQQAPLQPTSCSGGGVVPDKSSKVTLPSLFPEANPLLHPISTQMNTRSSMSFGELVMTEEDQNAIFSDLIFQSRQWDNRTLTQVTEIENPIQTP